VVASEGKIAACEPLKRVDCCAQAPVRNAGLAMRATAVVGIMVLYVAEVIEGRRVCENKTPRSWSRKTKNNCMGCVAR